MKVIVLGCAAVTLASCATVASQRERGARLELASERSIAELQGCITRAFEDEHYPVAYTPSERGGTFAYRVNGTLFWTLIVVDLGSTRQLSLYGASDKDLAGRIGRCAE